MANEFGTNISIGTNQWAAVWVSLLRMIRAGWWVRASSDGVTKVVSDSPTAHVGNTGTGFAPNTLAGQTGSAANVTAAEDHPNGQLVTLTGLTGLLSPNTQTGRSEGNFLTLSGAAQGALNATHQIYEVVSATSCKILNRGTAVTAPDANNGAITWTEKDVVTGASYGSLGSRQWWCLLEGPEVFQLTFTGAPVGDFLRGEALTQTGTGATGELVGIVWDPLTSFGWAVILPRTGAWNNSGLITGVASGATVTPANKYRWRRQVVFSKGSTGDSYTGSAWYNAFNHETAGHVTESYLTKASNAACTATVAPGGSTTAGNRQVNPSTSSSFYVLRCRNNSTFDGATALVHVQGIIGNTTNGSDGPNGRLQCCATNAMPRAGRSADGTWWIFQGNTAFSGGNLFGWFRVDGGDDGHCDPWISHCQCNSGSYRDVRYETTSGNSNQAFQTTLDIQSTSSPAEWMATWSCYVNSSGVAVASYNYGLLGYTMSPSFVQAYGAFGANWGTTQRLVAHPAAVAPGFKEPLGPFNGFRGRMRWLYLVQQGSQFNTYENRKFFQIDAYVAATKAGVILGPWDQVSDPVQA